MRAHDWQHRPQLDQVCEWWRGGGTGVCALVGIGGAGKTAIADRFLQILPGVIPQDAKIAKDPSLPTPHSTFVFSFYDAPNPEAFFEALQMWLEQTPRVSVVASFFQLMFMVQKSPGLLILDGLEKVQEDGGRGVLGKLASPKLRDFLDHVAAGHAPLLSVLITTRFPLADLRESKPQFFRTIPVEEIETAAGVQLLQAHGVRGTDPQLEAIVRECGNHALTIDFAGGYIREYGNGDPATRLNLGTAEELAAAAEKEPDDDRRGVLKQGFRFARVAERYRDAMLKNDEAALALLERICLFRLGADCQTLASIFTGEGATKVSGKALAALNAKELQQKLDWLVRMRIVEQSAPSVSENTKDSKLKTAYTIHPAVRDGFLGGIRRDEMAASHEAVRLGLEVSLGDKPGENPSDSATLDLLEEIVYHTLQSGHAHEAWDIFRNRIGGYENLGWRLGAYERGERICRALAGGETPENVVQRFALQAHDADRLATLRLYKTLAESKHSIFLNVWAMYLKDLGCLAAAARCHQVNFEMANRQKKWEHASIYNRNLCEVWLLFGRLTSSLSTAEKALELAERADTAKQRFKSHAYRAYALALRGEVSLALADFQAAIEWQHKDETDAQNRPLYSYYGVSHCHLINGLGRSEESTRLTESNKEICQEHFGKNDIVIPRCNLVLSDLHRESGDLAQAESLCASARDWAAARDAKEVLCWSALVQGRIELAREKETMVPAEKTKAITKCQDALAAGLKIARDCGFGLYHIDLLLERARLQLLQANPQAALDDLRVALDTGIPADDATGQPELLAATHAECGYAWAIPIGLQLRAEALLIQAAQSLGSDSFVVAKKPNLPAKVKALIQEAEACLTKALALWQPLRDPEPNNNNYRHPKTGEEYNYRAEETYRAIEDLAGGILTRQTVLVLRDPPRIVPNPVAVNPTKTSSIANPFAVALSFPGEHRSFVLEVAKTLADTLTRARVFYDEWYEVDLAGVDSDLKLRSVYKQAELVVPFFSEHYSKNWCALEWGTIRGILLTRRKDDAVIPVRLDDTEIKGWEETDFGIRFIQHPSTSSPTTECSSRVPSSNPGASGGEFAIAREPSGKRVASPLWSDSSARSKIVARECFLLFPSRGRRFIARFRYSSNGTTNIVHT